MSEPLHPQCPWSAGMTLTQFKSRLLSYVSDAAEVERLRHITPGFGKMLSYREKLFEAQQVKVDPVAADTLSAEQKLALYPILHRESVVRGLTLSQNADLVWATYLGFKSLEAPINETETAGKLAIEAAADASAAYAAFQAITWG